MEFTFSMGFWGAALLIVASSVFGVGVFLFGRPEHDFEWLFTSLAAFVGAFVASEFIVGFRTWEPVVDGMALFPALIGGVVLGLIVALGVRFVGAEAAASAR